MKITVGELRHVIREEVARDMHARQAQLDEGFFDDVKMAWGVGKRKLGLANSKDEKRTEENKKILEKLKEKVRSGLNNGPEKKQWGSLLEKIPEGWIYDHVRFARELLQAIKKAENPPGKKPDLRDPDTFSLVGNTPYDIQKKFEKNARLMDGMLDNEEKVKSVAKEWGNSVEYQRGVFYDIAAICSAMVQHIQDYLDARSKNWAANDYSQEYAKKKREEREAAQKANESYIRGAFRRR